MIMEGWTNKLALGTDGPTSGVAVWVGATGWGGGAARERNTLARHGKHRLGPLSVLSTERPLLQLESALWRAVSEGRACSFFLRPGHTN